MAKRFFWLKLPKDFFRQREIKKLRQIAGGDTYTIIYLKLLLLSLDTDGKLFYEGLESDFAAEMALVIDEAPENVAIAVNFLMSCGILQQNDEAEFELLTAHEMTGSEVDSAQRVREFRKRKALQSNAAPLLCNNDVTTRNREKRRERKDKTLAQDKPARDPDFDEFWAAYPKKRGKLDAQKAFGKVKGVSISAMLSALDAQKASPEWQDRRYIPYPATWLRRGGWMDEVSAVESGSARGEWNDAI